jgi:hypothetical protein
MVLGLFKNKPFSGWVESVVTFADQLLVEGAFCFLAVCFVGLPAADFLVGIAIYSFAIL